MTGIPISDHPAREIRQRQNKYSILFVSNVMEENRKDKQKKQTDY